MFTFSPGFEAATLKIPNKEYTAYGGVLGAAPGTSLVNGVNGLRGPTFQAYGGQNDPYNLVTVNQGGVVVDGGRDGTMASWPSSAPLADDLSSTQHFGGLAGLAGVAAAAAAAGGANANLPPRKQIIGFAKFRSREEALVARDVLQGRRVDIEKGAVLKAEMAKKNLHTKRGVGPVPGVNVGPGATTVAGATLQQNPASATSGQSQQQQHLNGMTGLDSFSSGTEPATFPPREHRDSVTLPGLARLGWRDSMGVPNPQQQPASVDNDATPTMNIVPNGNTPRAEEDRRRDSLATAIGTLSLSTSVTAVGPSSSTGSTAGGTIRGPRERGVDEDERERRRKEKEQKDQKDREREREMNLMRLRATNSAAFDAFHGVQPNNGLLGTASSSSIIGMSRQSSSTASLSGASNTGTNSTLLTPSSTVPTESAGGSSPMISSAEAQQQHQQDEIVGPWDRINPAVPVGRARSESLRSTSPTPQPPQVPSQQQQYRTHSESSQTSDSGAGQVGANPLGHIGAGLNGTAKSGGGSDLSASWPTNELASLSSLKILSQQQQQANGAGSSSSITTTSSGSNGNTSPTLPSPASGNSSGSASTTSASVRGTVDQNPPVSVLPCLALCQFFLRFLLSLSVPFRRSNSTFLCIVYM